MKRIAASLICISMIFSMTACGESIGSNGKKAGQGTGVNDVLEKRMSEEASQTSKPEETTTASSKPDPVTETETTTTAVSETPSVTETETETVTETSQDKTEEPVSYDDIDVDLTILSSTMVYSEVFNMTNMPDDYIGKTVKINGTLGVYHDEVADKYYFACINQDATACCAQGIEFELAGDYTYPDDYPAEGAEITVTGVFDTYVDAGYNYCTLRNAVMG